MSNAMGDQGFAVVKAAVASWMDEAGDAELYETCGGVTQILDLAPSLAGRTGERDRERFKGQVKRALDQLAGEGTLVKVGQGDLPPTGLTALDRPRWYTPAKLGAVKQAASLYADQLADQARRWEAVHAALTQAGYDPLTPATGPAMLALDGWERLAEAVRPPAVSAKDGDESLLRYRTRTRAAEVAGDLAAALRDGSMSLAGQLLRELTREVDRIHVQDRLAHT
jgi:hypothetical protein